MRIEEIKETMISIEDITSERMKKYLHYRSMKNFILYFSEIKNEREQYTIINLLSEYIEEIKNSNYDFDVYGSSGLARKYLFNIATYYRKDSNFMRLIKIEDVFIYGILCDSLLFFAGVLSKIYYVPVVTFGFLFYYLFIEIFKKPKWRVYGMFY